MPALETAYAGGVGTQWEIGPDRLALGSTRVAWLDEHADDWIAAATQTPDWILVNTGINDTNAPATLQAAFEASYGSLLDKLHTAWPSARILVTYPWARNLDAACDTMAGWIDNVLATRSPWAVIGDDERVWMKGADNGATMTNDGIHPNKAGNAEKVNQVITAMGY
jgi:lysophospholipase L1-like esterase